MKTLSKKDTKLIKVWLKKNKATKCPTIINTDGKSNVPDSSVRYGVKC